MKFRSNEISLHITGLFRSYELSSQVSFGENKLPFRAHCIPQNTLDLSRATVALDLSRAIVTLDLSLAIAHCIPQNTLDLFRAIVVCASGHSVCMRKAIITLGVGER